MADLARSIEFQKTPKEFADSFSTASEMTSDEEDAEEPMLLEEGGCGGFGRPPLSFVSGAPQV